MNSLSIFTFAFALLGSAWAAKLAAIGYRLYDGGGQGLRSPLAPLALFHDDVYLVLAFALVGVLAQRVSGGSVPRQRVARIAVATVYGTITLWMMFNIPVVRLMSSPVTMGFVHATGGALADSFSRYATLANLGIPLALWLGALALPWRLGRAAWLPALLRSRSARALGAALGALLLVAGPFAKAHVEDAGLAGNAVVVLARGLWTGPVGATDGERECPASETSGRRSDFGDFADFSDLAGLAAGRNVLWVILESTGARSLAPYGARIDVTPNLSSLAEHAVVLDHAYAAYPESIKGLYSMLCARSPPAHAEASEYGAKNVHCGSIAVEMNRAGYRTALFHSSWFAYLGMDTIVGRSGFALTVDASQIESPHRSSFGVDDRATARRLLAFVDGLPPGSHFFAVYMPIAGHHPYHAPGDGPRPIPEETEHDEYLNDLRVGDAAFGELRDGLRSRGLDEHMLYVVVGDHGEAFREHDGNVAHALFLYEENVHVPFLIAAPGRIREPRRALPLVSLVELAPTTLALLGLPVPEEYPRPALFSPQPRVVRFFTEQATRRAGLRDGRFKFLLNQETGRTELYDLARDPDERHDLAALDPDRIARYRACLAPPGPMTIQPGHSAPRGLVQ